tara:strand:+ start:906 stop:1340 length:435 start_codon:yes stop_codon:yes gene_type:complete
MAKLVIETQYMENYDVDEVTEDGHWKFKGGNTFITDDVDVNNVQSVANEIIPLIEYDNSMSREFVLEWRVEPDSWVSQYEKDQKEWSDGSMYHDPRLFKNEDGHWIKIRKFDGERGGYEYHDNLNTGKVIYRNEYENTQAGYAS